jgi:hypothetical protein
MLISLRPYQANRTLALLSKFFNSAEKHMALGPITQIPAVMLTNTPSDPRCVTPIWRMIPLRLPVMQQRRELLQRWVMANSQLVILSGAKGKAR